MTEKRANEILRTKYPEAEMTKGKYFGGSKSGRIVVVFKPNGKTYEYSASSYQQALEKLGFNILYKHNVEAIKAEMARMEAHIEKGYEEVLLSLTGEKVHVFSDEEISQMKLKVKELAEIIETSYIC